MGERRPGTVFQNHAAASIYVIKERDKARRAKLLHVEEEEFDELDNLGFFMSDLDGACQDATMAEIHSLVMRLLDGTYGDLIKYESEIWGLKACQVLPKDQFIDSDFDVVKALRELIWWHLSNNQHSYYFRPIVGVSDLERRLKERSHV